LLVAVAVEVLLAVIGTAEAEAEQAVLCIPTLTLLLADKPFHTPQAQVGPPEVEQVALMAVTQPLGH
jgi:hypothetical protein